MITLWNMKVMVIEIKTCYQKNTYTKLKLT